MPIFRKVCDIGFETDWDAMRIPSTKRICFVGKGTSSHVTKYENILKEKKQFVPRNVENEMTPRNCKNVDIEIKFKMTKQIVDELDKNPAGLRIDEIAKLFDSEMLKMLKSECGGIQTLMKNNKQILVVQGGTVRIRDWKVGSKDSWNPNPSLFKTRLCNFIRYRSSGCVRTADSCPFAHSESEIRKIDIKNVKRKKTE